MDFSLVAIWHHMGFIPKVLVVGMLLLSVYTLAVMLERALILRLLEGQLAHTKGAIRLFQGWSGEPGWERVADEVLTWLALQEPPTQAPRQPMRRS